MFDMANVEFSGFKDVDEPAMSDLKNALGKYMKRFSEICPAAEKLSIRMKIIHGMVGNEYAHRGEKYEIHASLTGKGRLYTATTTNNDLIFAVTSALDKIKKEMDKKACPA